LDTKSHLNSNIRGLQKEISCPRDRKEAFLAFQVFLMRERGREEKGEGYKRKAVRKALQDYVSS
jgi:hypothetical protein